MINIKILSIGAHFDDIELGCGGTLIKHKSNGDEIYMLVVTDSSYTSTINNHIRKKEEAYREGQRSAEILDSKLIVGNFETLKLSPSKELINYLSYQIKQINPDIVYTHFIGDQHLDHKAVAQATLIAARNVKEVYAYISNIYDTSPVFSPNYFVDISDSFSKKITLINCYDSEKETHLNWEKQLTYVNGLYGMKEGCDYAEPFQTIKILK